LQDGRELGIPVLGGRPSPCAEQREANFSASIKVRVEADTATACRDEVHLRWLTRVIIVTEDVILIATVSVRGVGCTANKGLHHVYARLIHSHEDCVSMLVG
jgi:hypothetical protein